MHDIEIKVKDLCESIPNYYSYSYYSEKHIEKMYARILQIWQENISDQPLIIAFICRILTHDKLKHMPEIYNLLVKIIEHYENINFNCKTYQEYTNSFIKSLIANVSICKLQAIPKVNKFLITIVENKTAWSELFAVISRYVMYYGRDIESENCLKQLINSWANGNGVDSIRDLNGNTILHLAIESQNYDIIILIINEWPFLMNATNNNKQNALFLLSSYYSIVDRFVSYGIDINALDINGDSMLYHNFSNDMSRESLEMLFNYNAKYVRKGVEVKSILHLSLALGFSLECFSKPDLKLPDNFINQQDEDGRTALHLAIILKSRFAGTLLRHNAATNTIDRFNRTPLDDAILTGYEDLVTCILNRQVQFDCPSLNANANLMTNVVKPSMLALACFTGSFCMYKLILNHINYKAGALDRTITSIVNEKKSDELFPPENSIRLKENLLVAHSVIEQLIILVAVKKILGRAIDVRLHIRTKVIPNLIGLHGTTFKRGQAFGIELELASIPSVTIIPHEDLLNWFSLSEHSDSSVRRSLFANKMKPEVVSDILDDELKLQIFLLAAHFLNAAGAKINKSTGLHVHVNIMGDKKDIPSIAARINVHNKYFKECELLIVKQILVNFAAIENMLRGFLRWGDIFIMPTSHTAMPIVPLIESYRKCNSFAELYAVNESRNAVNVHSLKTHGTLEFRLHEGCIDPVLIKAWFNLITRLVDMSVMQIQNAISKKTTITIVPANNIENLVYILIAERNYPKTWDPTWGAPRSADVEASDTDIQLKIQQSPLYNMFNLAKSGADFSQNNEFNLLDQEQKNRTLADLKEMVELAHKYPALAEAPISIETFHANLMNNNAQLITPSKDQPVTTALTNIYNLRRTTRKRELTTTTNEDNHKRMKHKFD